MNSTGMLPVNVNGSDAARLRACDEWLGCTVLRTVLERTTPEVAAAVGLPPYQVRGARLPWAGSPTTPLIDL